MKKAYSVVLSLLLVFSACIVETGCNQAQFDSVVTKIQNQVPNAVALAGDIGSMTGSAAIQPIVAAIGTGLVADLTAAKNTVDAYASAKSAGTRAAIFAAFSAAAQSFNAQFLQANHLANPQTDAAILAKLASLGVVLNGIELLLSPFSNSTAKAKADWNQVAPFIPKPEKDQMIAAFGYTTEQAQAFGL